MLPSLQQRRLKRNETGRLQRAYSLTCNVLIWCHSGFTFYLQSTYCLVRHSSRLSKHSIVTLNLPLIACSLSGPSQIDQNLPCPSSAAPVQFQSSIFVTLPYLSEGIDPQGGGRVTYKGEFSILVLWVLTLKTGNWWGLFFYFSCSFLHFLFHQDRSDG